MIIILLAQLNAVYVIVCFEGLFWTIVKYKSLVIRDCVVNYCAAKSMFLDMTLIWISFWPIESPLSLCVL